MCIYIYVYIYIYIYIYYAGPPEHQRGALRAHPVREVRARALGDYNIFNFLRYLDRIIFPGTREDRPGHSEIYITIYTPMYYLFLCFLSYILSPIIIILLYVFLEHYNLYSSVISRTLKFMFIYDHTVDIIHGSLFLCGRQRLCFQIIPQTL